jgi:VWFA-related protein
VKRGSVAAALPLFALLVCWPAGPLARQAIQQPFKAATNLVVVPVVVVDSKGAAVADLTQNDFLVREDGRPVAIETFTAPAADAAATDQSRFVVLVLDNLAVPAELAFRVRNIANSFVDKLGPFDVMSVIAINAGSAVTTNSKALLKQAVAKYQVAPGAEVMVRRAEHGLQMINSLTDQISSAPHQRKVMVFIGSAHIFSPSERSAFSSGSNLMSSEWMDAIRATARNNVSVYVIDPRGLENAPADWSQSFATETGGYSWARTNNFGAAADQIWRESATYYLIGYTAPVSDDRLHTIDVTVERKGVTVRARRARR